jgi:hypothetical protein
MLKWITYDGTEATLPPVNRDVLVKLAFPIEHGHEYIAAFRRDTGLTLWGVIGVSVGINEGDSWLPIPTPADCAKWEAVQALDLKPLYKRKPEDYVHTLRSCDKINAVVEALAALDTPKEQDNG